MFSSREKVVVPSVMDEREDVNTYSVERYFWVKHFGAL